MFDPAKELWIKELRRLHKINFLCFQETKVQEISPNKLSAYWGNEQFEHKQEPSRGLYGGLACIWNPNVFKKHSSVSARNYILITGKLIGSDEIFHILNTYAPADNTAKRNL